MRFAACVNQGGFASRYAVDHLRELDLPLPEALREVSRRLFQSLTQDHSVNNISVIVVDGP